MDLLSPFLIGSVLALLLDLPLRAIERHLPGRGRLRRGLSLACVFSLVLAAVTVLLSLVLPQLADSARALAEALPDLWERLRLWGQAICLRFALLRPLIQPLLLLDFEALVQNGLAQLFQKSALVGGTVDLAAQMVTHALDLGIGLVLAAYLLARKEQLARQARLLLRAWLPPRAAAGILQFFRLCSATFSAFFSGQCLEAFLLGCLFALVLAVCRFPCVALISIVIGCTALVPVFGSIVGCLVGVLTLLAVQPQKAPWFVVLFLCIQQLEGNLIYPRVVGSKVGLPPLWVLVAVTLGGRAFGPLGMLGMIPIFGVLYTLLRQLTAARLKGQTPADPPPRKTD